MNAECELTMVKCKLKNIVENRSVNPKIFISFKRGYNAKSQIVVCLC